MFSISDKKIYLLGKNRDAAIAYFKLKGKFEILGFIDNEAKEESTFCGTKCYTLRKMKNLGGVIAIVYGKKSITICNWLKEHGYELFNEYIPWFMFEYDCIDFYSVLSVTPPDKMDFVLERMRKGRKAVLIHGNCQTSPMKLYLKKNSRFSSEFIIYDIPPIHAVNKNKEMVFQSEYLYKDVNLFITHVISEKNKFGYHLSTDYLQKHLPEKCRIVKVINLWFEGYFPQHGEKVDSEVVCHIPGAFCWQDINLERMGERKENIEEILSVVKNDDYYPAEFLQKNFETALKNLRERENVVDIGISEYLADICKKEVLFYSVNHPKNIVIKEIIRRVLRYIGLYNETEIIEFKHELLLDQEECLKIACEAVYPSVFKFLGIKGSGYTFNYPGVLQNRDYMTFEEYVKDYMAFNFSYEYEE